MPGWSRYYLDYKSLKKIISSLEANRPVSEAAAIAVGQLFLEVSATKAFSKDPQQNRLAPRYQGFLFFPQD